MTARPSRPRVVAIVQARMGSTRLPGKVLRNIAGRPLLWHIIHRLRRCKTLDTIAVATSGNERDNAVADFCRAENITCVRGPEDNVLERFALAAARTKAGVIVRVSSDAPFLDAQFIDHLVTNLIEQDGDYVMLEPGSVCAHEGVDPFSRRALDKLLGEAAGDPIAREHVSGYFKLHPAFVRIVHAPADPRFAHEGARLTIDTPDDLAFIETLYERMAASAGEASLADLLSLLEREPKLKAMNAHVRQKTLEARGGRALIRCDGGGVFGFGHVRRALSVARALRDHEGVAGTFALHGGEAAAALPRAAGFETAILPPANPGKALMELARSLKPDLLVCDAREGLTRAELARLAADIGIAAVIDDSSERRLAATHAYYPPVPQAETLSFAGARTEVRIGWEWAVLGFDPERYAGGERKERERPRLVVSMGGSDPFDLTRAAARALTGVNARFSARFVIGPGVANAEALCAEIEAMSPAFSALRGLSDPAAEFAAADLALIAFGVTAYELAALGIPALYLAISPDHALSASAFEHAGMGILLGHAQEARGGHIGKAVWNLLRDAERRREMRAAGLSLIDGRGAARIAADLAAALAAAREATRARA